MRRVFAIAGLGLALACDGWEERPNSDRDPELRPASEWPSYGGADARQFSELDRIDRDNVEGLEVAWSYRRGDVAQEGELTGPSSFQATPILVEGVLYFPTPLSRVVALDPASGAEHWSHDPGIDRSVRYSNFASRGVAHWRDPAAAADAPCASRILFGTVEGVLLALDARTGELCGEFGAGGRIDLHRGVGETSDRGEYGMSSPPLVLGDRVVVGSLVADNRRSDAPSGVVRAYGARRGELLWAFDLAPPGFDYATRPTSSEGYALGTPNVWAPMVADAERDLVFVPTGNPAPDYYRAGHADLDHYGSSVVALRGASGEVVWSFQTVHHDRWDYDVPAQPTLVDLPREGGTVPALVQATKMGLIFVLHRETGEPLFEVEERPVPQRGAVEPVAATQPFPVKPPPLQPLELALGGASPIDRWLCGRALEQMRYDGIYTPPGTDWSVTYPAPLGGVNWGGVAIDPRHHRLYVNSSDIALKVRLLPREEYDAGVDAGFDVYTGAQRGTPYAVQRDVWIEWFAPCNRRPWGRLTAVDLVAGEILWEEPFGKLRDFTPIPLPLAIGMPSLGGPLVTGGGLLFIGGAAGHWLRAFDVESGEELWRGGLPAGANATPMTYAVTEGERSRQFVVVAAGGHWSSAQLGDTIGDTLVAFALPERE